MTTLFYTFVYYTKFQVSRTKEYTTVSKFGKKKNYRSNRPYGRESRETGVFIFNVLSSKKFLVRSVTQSDNASLQRQKDWTSGSVGVWVWHSLACLPLLMGDWEFKIISGFLPAENGLIRGRYQPSNQLETISWKGVRPICSPKVLGLRRMRIGRILKHRLTGKLSSSENHVRSTLSSVSSLKTSRPLPPDRDYRSYSVIRQLGGYFLARLGISRDT